MHWRMAITFMPSSRLAINNDGSLKVGYTAPSVDGQRAAITEALAVAGVDAGSIGFVETHGTATELGDPIEVTALTKAYRHSTDQVGYCAVSSVKPNIGHLDRAAGVTGLIKAALSLQRELITRVLHFEKPNPNIDFANSPFLWPQRSPGRAVRGAARRGECRGTGRDERTFCAGGGARDCTLRSFESGAPAAAVSEDAPLTG